MKRGQKQGVEVNLKAIKSEEISRGWGRARERNIKSEQWKVKKPIKGKTAVRNPFIFSYLSFFQVVLPTIHPSALSVNGHVKFCFPFLHIVMFSCKSFWVVLYKHFRAC